MRWTAKIHSLVFVSAAVLWCLPLGGAQKGWIELIRGVGLSAWRRPTGEWIEVGSVTLDPKNDRRFAWREGKGVLVNGRRGRTVNLVSKLEHADCEAHVEFVVPRGSNSGVYFMGRYEIQILDSWDASRNAPKRKVGFGDCGGIYQRWVNGRGFEGRPPRVNACRPPGKWQAYDVVFQAPRFDSSGKKTANAKFLRVVHNGILIHEDEEVSGPTRAAMFNDEKPTGPLMLQGDHGPVAYRNIRIRLLPEYDARKLVPDELLARVASYDWTGDRKPLAGLEENVRSLPLTAIRLVEERLLLVLKDPKASVPGKRFVLKLLRRIGSKACVPVVARYLTDPVLSHMARLTLQGLPYGEVDAALHQALGKADYRQKIGIITTLADRGDRNAASLLAPLAASRNRELAEAAISALGRIGGPEAAAVLLKLEVPRTLRDALGEALLSCASSLKRKRKGDLLESILQRIRSGPFSERIKEAAGRLPLCR